MNKAEAYLLGAYITDGHIQTNKNGWMQFRLEVIDESFAMATHDAIQELGHKTNLYERRERGWKGKTLWDTYTGSQELCEWLVKTTFKKVHVPVGILEAQKPIQLEFLAGVMDGDGFITYGKPTKKTGPNGQYVIGIGACGAWVHQVRYMMQQLGVKVGKMTVETKNRNMPLTRFTVNKPSFVEAGLYFKNGRKQDRLRQYIHDVYRSSQTTREAS